MAQDSQICGGNFPKRRKMAAELCQIFHMVTIKIIINSTCVMGTRVTISCRYSIAFEVMLFTGRIATKRQTTGIKFTHRPKIWFFAWQGRLVAPIHVKLGRANWHMGTLGVAKFHLNRCRGWECGPKNIKNFYFLVESPRRGKPFD